MNLLDPEVFEYFVKPGEVSESGPSSAASMRHGATSYSRGIVSGYFDDHAAFCDAVQPSTRSSTRASISRSR